MALSSPPPQSDPSLFSSSPTPPLSHCYYQSPQKTLHRKLSIINYNISQSKNQNKNPSSIQRSAQPTPKSAPFRQPKPILSTPKPRSAPRPSTQATLCSTQAISFFLAMENRERTENRWRERSERTEKRGRAEEKKLKREKISGKMKDKGKKKSLNRRVKNNKQSGWRVYSNFSFVKSSCNKMGIWRPVWRIVGARILYFALHMWR